MGIDDLRDSACSSPPLTSFTVPKIDLGKTAVAILHNLIIQGDMPPARTVLLGQIVVRQSSGAPRA